MLDDCLLNICQQKDKNAKKKNQMKHIQGQTTTTTTNS